MNIKYHKRTASESEIPEFGMPRPWIDLIAKPSPANARQVSRLLEAADSDRGARHIEHLANQDLSEVGEFLASCSSIEFFFIGWDHRQFTVVQRAGPDKRRVRSLLKWDSSWRGRQRQTAYRSADAEVCEKTWQAVQTILEVLNAREKTSYVLFLNFRRFPGRHAARYT